MQLAFQSSSYSAPNLATRRVLNVRIWHVTLPASVRVGAGPYQAPLSFFLHHVRRSYPCLMLLFEPTIIITMHADIQLSDIDSPM